MEKTREERIFQQWVAQLPWMGQDNFISFRDYKDKVTGANIDRRSVAEIEAELAEVVAHFETGGAADGS